MGQMNIEKSLEVFNNFCKGILWFLGGLCSSNSGHHCLGLVQNPILQLPYSEPLDQLSITSSAVSLALHIEGGGIAIVTWL